MALLSGPRLDLLPLSRALVEQRLQGAPFDLRLPLPGGERPVQVPAEWPGDLLPLFPHKLAHWPQDQPTWPGSFVAVHRAQAQAIGQLGIKGPLAPEVEIGYGLSPAVWGQGYATEAAGLLLAWLADQGVQTVTAQTALTNPASARVLQKLGFAVTGEATDPDDGPLHLWARPLA
ncbi:GNAT family N-acetyltransferase [Deinococcus multiflagellatus]|uniref:GNAT family N-acetyltransferase n=1 Tax=Deinococcus multiflagellatus TaxID=1656887 RepID=A0ABW1ZN75_9DEIO|nr:GNAT family N-acetyltransferase [Deinococcus multiflagellatus]MBZ9716012.1 GNAT family N-acetyltransferase [Deinococcus multiflagellatus]